MATGAAPTEDPFGGRAFVSPAKIRILLTPAGPNVTPADFERWAAHVRSFESIQIADLPLSKTGRAGPGPGSPFYRFGEVHLSFVTSYDPAHSFLAPFAMHKQVLGVLGLGSFDPTGDKMTMEKAPSALRELHPNAIIHRVYLFDTNADNEDSFEIPKKRIDPAELPDIPEGEEGEEDAEDGEDDTSFAQPADPTAQLEAVAEAVGFGGRGDTGLIIFPAIRRDEKDVRFYLRTLLREFVSSLLDGLDSIVKGLEGKALETPRETLEGGMRSSMGSSSAGSTAMSPTSSAASRASSFFSSFSAGTSSPSSASSPTSSTGIGGGNQPPSMSSNGTSNRDSKTAASRSSAAAAGKAKRTTSLVGAGPTGAGRYTKLKADYFLLCGDLWSAISEYDSCMTWLGKERALAGGQDAVWYASALEGWAVTRCLIFRMRGLEDKGPSLALPTGGVKEKEKKEKDHFELPFAKYEWGDVAEAYAIALQIYSKTLSPPRHLLEAARTVTNETPRDYTHPLIHSSACIAYARLLLSIWASSGWNAECFDQLIYGGVPPSLVEDARPNSAMYAALSKESGVQRHEIAIPTSLALSHSVSALKPPDQIAILCSLANIYGCIGFLRREAYLLRQLQATVVSLLARALILHPREPVTVATVLRQIAGSDHAILGNMVSQTLRSGLGDGADAVLILALQICETYGINVDMEPIGNIPAHHVLSKAAITGKKTATGEPLLQKKNLRATWGAQSDGDADISFMQEESAFGWADLQVALLKDTICVAEMLQDHVGMAFFATLLLRDFHELLSGDEQRSLMRGVAACVKTARWQDAQNLDMHYWGPAEPVASVEAEALPTERLPVEHPAKDLLEAHKESQAEGVAGLNNPFFWNPVRVVSQSTEATFIENEAMSFLVTLQNPFKAPLDLTNVRLSTFGAAFDADSTEVTLPPLAYHTVRLTGHPREPGKVIIRGCFCTLSGCSEKEFLVNRSDEASEKSKSERDAEADDRRSRLKVQGLDARPAVMAQKRAAAESSKIDEKSGKKAGTKTAPRFLECKILPSQPSLSVDSPSLTHGQLILYDGETTTFKLRLTNVSPLPVDFARIKFTDDLSEDIQASLADGQLLPEDAHQLEWELIHQPVFRCSYQPREIRIAPGRSLTLPVKVRGKLDCTSAAVTIDFAHVDAPGRGGLATEETKNFYTRRVTLPFGVTVYSLVECGSLDVKPLAAQDAERLTSSLERMAMTPASLLLNGDHASSVEDSIAQELACLVSLDVRNLHRYAVDVEVTLERDIGRPLTISESIAAASTARLALALPKLRLSRDQYESAIPSLSSRQFIVSGLKQTTSEARRARMRFWYRSELLKRLRATWRDPRSGRSGDLLLNEQALTDEHVALLQPEDLSVELTVFRPDGTEASPLSEDLDATVKAKAEEFVEIQARIRNTSGRSLKLLYRLVPLPSTSLDSATNELLPATVAARNRPASTAIGQGGGSSQGTAAGGSAQGQPLTAAGIHSSDSTLSQLFITNGGLSCAVQPWPLEDGEEAVVKTGLGFLSQGKYAFVGAVEEALEAKALDKALSSRAVASAGQEERITCISKRMLVVEVGASEGSKEM